MRLGHFIFEDNLKQNCLYLIVYCYYINQKYWATYWGLADFCSWEGSSFLKGITIFFSLLAAAKIFPNLHYVFLLNTSKMFFKL